jgi:hypothetical protein
LDRFHFAKVHNEYNPVPDELAQRELREELLLMQLVQEARQPLLKHFQDLG